MIDGLGGGYFWSTTYLKLRHAGVPVARFLHSPLPWRMPFLNLRSHKKLLSVDGRIAFVGGLNIGAENLVRSGPAHPVLDTHFSLEGPVVAQIIDTFADDWLFMTGERLAGEQWFPAVAIRGREHRARRHFGARSGPGENRAHDSPSGGWQHAPR